MKNNSMVLGATISLKRRVIEENVPLWLFTLANFVLIIECMSLRIWNFLELENSMIIAKRGGSLGSLRHVPSTCGDGPLGDLGRLWLS